MRGRSSKRAIALQPSEDVKRAVWERDNHHCILCGSKYAWPVAHYIPRSKGGLGIEQNIVTLCDYCHDAYDHGARILRNAKKEQIKLYLSKCYTDWNEDELIYRRH